MPRWIALLLIALLPLQVSWSIAAEYGHHGATLAAPHAVAHEHGHVHTEAAGDILDAEADDGAQTSCCDVHQCHSHGSFFALTALGGIAALASAAGYSAQQVGRVQSREATRIERPKWAASPITS